MNLYCSRPRLLDPCPLNVRLGLKADVTLLNFICFAPESGH
jgi:hypothetical protein